MSHHSFPGLTKCCLLTELGLGLGLGLQYILYSCVHSQPPSLKGDSPLLGPHTLTVTLRCGWGWGCVARSLLYVWFSAVQESLVSEEIAHDLDTCEVTVEGEELNPEQERLEVDVARLQQKGIEVSHSDLGVVFTGEGLELSRGAEGRGRLWPACCLQMRTGASTPHWHLLHSASCRVGQGTQ